MSNTFRIEGNGFSVTLEADFCLTSVEDNTETIVFYSVDGGFICSFGTDSVTITRL